MSRNSLFVDAARTLLYRLGVLGLFHRLRNARTLTVFMFHRVLPPDSLAYRRSEREFTLTTNGFARCLDFIERHYNVVSFERLKEARESCRPLPSRAALITFDDGWRDTLRHACPELSRRGLLAVMFLATEAPELPEDRWWQDALVELMRDRAIIRELMDALGMAATQADALALSAALAALPATERASLLASLLPDGANMERQMVTQSDLLEIDGRMLALAAHGHTHAPLTRIADPGAELAVSRERVATLGGDATAMSFPHGDLNSGTEAAARAAGFEWLFSSNPCLNDYGGIRQGYILGRIHVPENEWTCEDGRISPARLATFLFFRKIDADAKDE